MKTRIIFFFALLMASYVCRAQDDQPANFDTGWFLSTNGISSPVDIPNFHPNNANPGYPGGTSAIAEAITPDISALARNLNNDPNRIFNFVHDHIRYVHYFGSHKGAELTLLERSGNDFDQCSLLVALLTAAGYSPLYAFGVVTIPYSSNNQQDYQHWVGVTMPNTNWNNSITLAATINQIAGYPLTGDFSGDTNDIIMHHVWVLLTLNGTNYTLDPAFKISLPVSGLTLESAMQLNTNTLFSAATNGSTATADYVQGLNEGNLRSTLQSYNSNLLAYIQTNCPNNNVQQILSGQALVPYGNQPISQVTWPFTVQTQGAQWPVSGWSYIPTSLMAVLIVNLPGTNNSFYLPGLAGSRLSIVCTSNGVVQLWQEDTNISSVTLPTGSSTFTPTIGIQHPYGTNWDFTVPGFSAARWSGDDQSVSTQPYQCSNATYIVLYGLDVNSAWLTKRQQQLDTYRQQGYADSSPQVTKEALNVMGLGWFTQTELVQEFIAGQTSTLDHFHHRLGRMAEEAGRGYYIDVYEQVLYTAPVNIANSTYTFQQNQAFQVSSYFLSAMEHGIIEQMQNTNLVGASTVKLLEIASTNNEKIYLATSTNWSSGANVSGNISNYSTGGLYTNFISQGYYLLLPQNGSIQIAGSGSWAGAGYVAYVGSPTGLQVTKMIIGGGYNGGYVSDPTAEPSPPVIVQQDTSQSTYYFPQSSTASVSPPLTADPVNPIDGTFQVSSLDLSVGGVEPRGLNFNRSYSSARRNSNPAGMAPGWLHSFYGQAVPVSAPLAGLGGTTPQQMAPMIVAVRATLDLYNSSQPSPASWVTTALIAKWSLDQLTAGAVSVNLGDATLEFIKQPDGSYTPPANCTMSLAKTNGAYWLSERHGRTFKFATNSYLTNIVDQYGQGLTLAYNASNWVSTVTDWKGRSLSFTYSGSPSRLTAIADSGGRTVSYGYTSNANGVDLTSVTDPTGATSSFSYDTNHQIVATLDALGNLVVSNIYGNQGQITTQYTQGLTNKTWRVFCSGFNTLVVDPAGGVQESVFDIKARPVGSYDALSNFTQLFYDGQDHLVMSVSPLLETNQFFYDGYNNLTYQIDPLGYSNQYFYDASFNLTRTIDKNGHTNYSGYNAKFQLIASTNGTGDWTTNSYDSTYGLLISGTDPGGTTTYGYDTYGQLSSVIYPSSLGTNLFVNNSLGDVITNTNPRGFTTSFQYNLRRQLTNTVSPTNLTVSIAYDAVGNATNTTDARGFSTLSAWSVTRHLLATTLPLTPQGNPVLTNIYDTRDWLVRSLDPLQKPTTNSYDLAGRLLTATDPLLRTTTVTYDNDGRRLSVTDAASETTSQQWNARGQATVTTDPMSKNILKAFDGVGNQILLTNRNHEVWQFHFDAANRLTNTMTPMGRSNYQVWNNRGLLQTNKDFMGQPTVYTYDARGRLTNLTDNVASTTYQFDADSNQTNVFELGKTNSWTFDAYDRPITYSDSAGNLIKYGYDANGNVTNLTYPGNRVVSYFYDNLNRLTNVTDWANRKTTYIYDLDSHVTSIIRPNGTIRSNFYDAAGELTNIIEQAATRAPIAFFKMSYNAAARVQWEFAAPLPATNAMPSRTLQYDADNRLTNFNGSAIVNDADGNMTGGPLTNSTLQTYAYDARNRLTGAGGLSYAYDPANNRVAITNGTNVTLFVIDAKTSQALMRIKNGITNYYVYGLGLIYEEDDTATSTNTLTYHFDSRGSTVALTDTNGNVTDRIQYSAYGMVIFRGGTNDTPFQYNGRYGVQTDANGLLYMRARFYNPYICRFINPDPSGFSGGLNFYAYANGDPISLTDPFGLASVTDSQSSVNTVSSVTSLPGAVTPPSLNIAVSAPTLSSYGPIDLSNIPQPTANNNGPTAFLGPPTPGSTILGVGSLQSPNPLQYFQTQDLTIGSNLDPASPAAQGIAELNAQLYDTVLPLPGLATGTTAADTANVVADVNKLNHIFGNAEHGLDGVVNIYGSQQAAFNALQQATQAAVQQQKLTGIFETAVQVGGQTITVRGNVINGVAKIGTAFK